jgi:D-lactate dehydrogenase
VVLHPNCASRKLNEVAKLLKIAETCAATATIPLQLDCCGFAGDRGLLFPELTDSATRLETAEVLAGNFDGYYSSNLTCEMGIGLATGKPYRSIAYLVEKATKEG